MLCRQKKNAVLFRDKNSKYRPFSLFCGPRKIEGWTYAEKTGEILSVPNTYESGCDIRIYGTTVLIGSGAVSPANPHILTDTKNFNLISSDEDNRSSAVYFPYTLRSLPDGTRDCIEIDYETKQAKLVCNVGKTSFSGLEAGIGMLSTYGPEFYVSISPGCITSTTTINCICSHLTAVTRNDTYRGNIDNSISAASAHCRFRMDSLNGSLQDFKDFLAAHHYAGTPVTVAYMLAVPIEIPLDYTQVKTFYPHTKIYTDAAAAPALEGRLRVFGQ